MSLCLSRAVLWLGVSLGLGLPLVSEANCVNTKVSQTEDNRTAQIPFGRINLTSTYFQPEGGLLATAVVPPTNYTYGGATASSVLWHCLESDLPNLYYLVATNGDDRVGGFWDIGGPDGLSDVYATWFEHVGIRLTMDGMPLRRHWQAVPITAYDQPGDGRIYIRLQDLPTMVAEIYRVSMLPPSSGSGSNYCTGLGTPTAAGQIYTCNQPNAYIQLVGPGLTHDNIGEDSNNHYVFWGVDNGFGYGMRQASTLSNNATCVARTATPLVMFPTLSVQQLQAGVTAQSPFSVEIECSNVATDGVAAGQTAVGIQVSPGAYSAAQSLGLVNSSGGVAALVSDTYGTDPNMAAGVGVTLRNAATDEPLVFVAQPGLTGTRPTGNPSGRNAGWYPAREGASAVGATQAGYTRYRLDYNATLGQLPGQTVTAGRYRATAYVLVKVQ